MDADLQHPPEKLPELLAPLEKNEADFVIGSRYVAGGTTQGEWGLFRQINSQVATLLARPFAGRTLDPMSGFFALKRASFENAENLTPLGYKIGLELMCKCRAQKIKEIPITFATREKGQSKLSMKEQFRYLEHLSRLYDFCYPRLSPITKFTFVTLVGWFVGLGVVAAYLSLLRPVQTSLLAYAVSLGITMIFHVRYIRTQREFIVDRNPWLSFMLISGAELVAVWLTSWWMEYRITEPGSHPVEFWSIVYAAGILVRYVLRKELLQDIRGLRKDLRMTELKHS
jgi:glycosyltransferase involved in cell wall biosynthesis